jgi:hypothetical protein
MRRKHSDTTIMAEVLTGDKCKNVSNMRWVPCHNGMARRWVADGEDGLQIWRVAANILNKQSRRADKG